MKKLDLSVFPKPDKGKWLQLAQDQLKGANPMNQLMWDSHGLSDLAPYYDSSDLSELDYLKIFFSNANSRRWKLYERIEVIDEKVANHQALSALMGGCDGIIFICNRSVDMTVLLKEINRTICDVSFISNHLVQTQNNTGIFKDKERSNCVFESTKHTSSVNQILDVMNQVSNQSFIHRTAFRDFFIEIASLRALQYLIDKEKKASLHVHTVIPLHESDDHQWFLNTTACLASILGGSHSIDMPTAIGDSRITRNIGNLIRDESGINEYSDQCGGSYFVDSLTHKIIQSVKKELEK